MSIQKQATGLVNQALGAAARVKDGVPMSSKQASSKAKKSLADRKQAVKAHKKKPRKKAEPTRLDSMGPEKMFGS